MCLFFLKVMLKMTCEANAIIIIFKKIKNQILGNYLKLLV